MELCATLPNVNIDTSLSALLHRNTRFIPKKAIGGKGSYLFLEDGQRVLDSTGGAAVSCLGHGNDKINAAVISQINQLSYCHTAFFGTQVSEDLAKFLVDSTGGKLSKLYVVSSGSEAMEAALKLARQYYLELPTSQPKRTRFIARLPSYHGITLGALSVSGHVSRREPFEPLLGQNTSHVSPCFAYRGKKEHESDADYVARLATELDAEFQRVGPENVCAFIAEPLVGAVCLLSRFPLLPLRSIHANRYPGPWLRPSSTRLLPGHESRLRATRRTLHSRRGHERHGPLRYLARMGTRRRHPGHPNNREGFRWWVRSCFWRADGRPYRAGYGQRHRCFPPWPDVPRASSCMCSGIGSAKSYTRGESARECKGDECILGEPVERLSGIASSYRGYQGEGVILGCTSITHPPHKHSLQTYADSYISTDRVRQRQNHQGALQSGNGSGRPHSRDGVDAVV